MLCQLILVVFGLTTSQAVGVSIPLVINTWRFTNSTKAAWDVLLQNKNFNESSAKDALVIGCSTCEKEQCDKTVGYGGSPDENGETTLDALIFDGTTMDMGAVGGLRRIKDAISVARDVLDLTDHSFLVGELATQFAKTLNYKVEDLSTSYSQDVWRQWRSNKCQPNFWKNVVPNPKTSCGPYEPISANALPLTYFSQFNSGNHDTIGMIIIDQLGNVVAGTSTNGANHKVPGRVGDSPIPGAGAYADSEVGAAVATGDGDVMMRFLPSFLAVEEIRRGSSPTEAAQIAINRIVTKYPLFFGGVVAVNNKGEYGAACNGMTTFPFSVVNKELKDVTVKTVKCKT